jgi:hypothetical protein
MKLPLCLVKNDIFKQLKGVGFKVKKIKALQVCNKYWVTPDYLLNLLAQNTSNYE